jgi:hypothetical protein
MENENRGYSDSAKTVNVCAVSTFAQTLSASGYT